MIWLAEAGAEMAVNPAATVAMSAKRTGVMFLLPIFLVTRTGYSLTSNYQLPKLRRYLVNKDTIAEI